MAFSRLIKEISYRGGVVRFFIPEHWNEEYEEDGGGIFYEPGDETGTLRLNVLSFLTEGDVSARHLLAIVQKRAIKNNGQIEVLPNDRFLLKYSIKICENGEDLTIFYWEVAKMVSPRDYNIAVFSFTIAALQSQLSSMLELVSSIEEEIKKVRFGLHGDAYES